MMTLKELLNCTVGIDGWRINTNSTKSYELFFVHRNLETVRSTDTSDTQATVFVSHDGSLGDATFSVYTSDTEKIIKKKIEEAKERAAKVSNRSYELEAAEELDAVLPSNLDTTCAAQLGEQISAAVFAADAYEGGSINALEIFIYEKERQVENSRGLSKKERSRSVMIEAIPTWTQDGESVELYENHRFSNFVFDEVKSEIDRRMCEVRDRFSAKAPTQKLALDVLLCEQELSSLIRNVTRELGMSTVYTHSNVYKLGDLLQPSEADCDKLDVTLCAVIDGACNSSYFDSDGTALKDVTVIKNGEVVAYHGTSRYAQYLGLEKTGALPCTSLASGTLTKEALANRAYLEVVSMSGLQLDTNNDYIGGEVRLAYLYDGKGGKTPITGISLSGKLSEALATLRLADECTTTTSYRGPAFALISGIEIV